MRKTTSIVLGLALVIGAAGFYTVRHADALKPLYRTLSGRSVDKAERTTGTAPRTRSLRPGRIRERVTIRQSTFDRVLDILNLVVGALGIWFSISGIRMQRAASQMMAGRDDYRE